MSKPNPPVPLPRRKFFPSNSTEDDNLLPCSPTPQSPTKSPQGGSVSSTPPPVSPKKWILSQSSGGFDSGNGTVEIVKGGSVSSTPPPVSPKKWILSQSSGGFDSGNGTVEIVKGGSVSSTPPPVSPKKWIVRPSSGGFESGNGTVEIVKVVAKPPVYNCQPKASPLPQKIPKERPHDGHKMDDISLSNWQNGLKPWTSLCKDLQLRGEEETKIIKDEAKQLYKAIQRYIFLLSKHGDTLKGHTAELLCIADNLDKVSKGTKIAGITGGATTAAGGVAAAAGVILAPVTMGLSLALTAVGVGVAAAGGVTGASAAIANKANVSQGKKKLEKTFHEYKDLMVNIQDCLKFINEGLEQLKQHDLSVLSEARKESVKVAKMVQLATTGRASARAIEANSKASGLMEGFALGIDLFIQGKNGQRPKKDLKSALATKIRKLAEELNKGLDELKELFSEQCSGVKGF
ncbi:apolipoprotein L6-like isoform X2 [Perca fluviatilis]|uniref:apolipoprotein L6-like isoform X2 n=1 Tax=Perca fluviatilis TaxID=8168 RepID=UPI001962A9B3|nr:apolipoprotein L6-like isoform X2 [Perca fluviatilis]